MLPILTNLKNSISCSLKKINNIGQTANNNNNNNVNNDKQKFNNNKNNSESYLIKNSFDSGINNFEIVLEEDRKDLKKKLGEKLKSKSLSKREKTYQDYMNKRFSTVTTRSEFYLNNLKL